MKRNRRIKKKRRLNRPVDYWKNKIKMTKGVFGIKFGVNADDNAYIPAKGVFFISRILWETKGRPEYDWSGTPVEYN